MVAEEPGIVVIGRNERERLLHSLTSLGPNAHKIVYIDSDSADNSVLLAARLGAFVVNLDLSRRFTASPGEEMKALKH
jgi:hypothetical protein